MKIFAPSLAKWTAIERPRPVPPPLMKIARPLNISGWNIVHRLATTLIEWTFLCFVFRGSLRAMTRIRDLLDDRFSGLRCKGGANCRTPRGHLRRGFHFGGYGTSHGLRIFGGVSGIGRKFLRQLKQEFLSQGILFLASSG